MNVDQLKKKYKHHCHIPIFEFKGVCVCACNLYEGLHENVHVFSSYHYMYHPPSYSKITIKQHYQRVCEELHLINRAPNCVVSNTLKR